MVSGTSINISRRNRKHVLIIERLASQATFESDPEKLTMLRNWRTVDKEITRFVNNSKQSTFQYLFDEEEGERLWMFFVIDCKRSFLKLLDGLVDDQFNDMMANICFNEILYAK